MSFVIFNIYLAGFLMFFTPCIFPLLPVYISVLERDGRKIFNTVMFLLGLSLTFVLLGFGAGAIGFFLTNPIVIKIAALIVIILGIVQLDIIKFNFLNNTKLFNIKYKGDNAAIESFVLGLSFSLGWTPCIGPILGTILLYAGDSSSAVYGAFLLTIFVLGFSTPFVIFSTFYNKLSSKLGIIKRNLGLIKKISGVLIIIMGLALFFDKLEFLVAYFNALSI